MKTNFISILLFFSMLLLFTNCEEEDYTFGDIIAPSALELSASIVGASADTPFGDGTGLVNFSASGENVITYKYVFSDGTEEIASGGFLTKRFTSVGINTYDVTLVATGTAGVATTTSLQVTVESNFSDPELIGFLTGNGSKTWYWAADEPGHLGVGQNDDNELLNYYANYYQAAPFEKNGSDESLCFYQDDMVFSFDGERLTFQLNNYGQTFFNGAYEGVAGGSNGFDYCYDYEVQSTPQVVSLAPAESFVVANEIPGQTRGTNLIFSEGGFMSYYVGSSTYEIISITANRLVVRTIQGNNAGLAWYHIFSSTSPSESTDNTDYTNLVWSDEFDTSGTPNPANWDYNIGRGDNGWGNGESQTYTDRPENVRVEDGVLKITAKRENFGGAEFTSARIKTENKFEFTYGKIEMSAKLPIGGGTWPALWMLGEDYATNTWPGCGEIDIMEHVGNRQDQIFSSLHFPGNSGGEAVTQSINEENVAEEFKVYSAIWSPETIRFFVDGELYHTFANGSDLPFNSDFFLIFNVAMGGNFGGDISPDFQESTMEVDYVRVFQ